VTTYITDNVFVQLTSRLGTFFCNPSQWERVFITRLRK